MFQDMRGVAWLPRDQRRGIIGEDERIEGQRRVVCEAGCRRDVQCRYGFWTVVVWTCDLQALKCDWVDTDIVNETGSVIR